MRAGGERQHPLLHHGALRVLVLEEDVLLQHLDGKEALAASLLGQQHLQQTCREFNRRPRRRLRCPDSKQTWPSLVGRTAVLRSEFLKRILIDTLIFKTLEPIIPCTALWGWQRSFFLSPFFSFLGHCVINDRVLK